MLSMSYLSEAQTCHLSSSAQSISDRYSFSKYIIDPNKYGWKKATSTLALVIKFLKLKSCLPKPSSKDNNALAQEYFFMKSTQEVKKFTPSKRLANILSEKNGILYYNERILPIEKITSTGKLTNTMFDLSSSTFIVPVFDRYSPIAYSIVNFIHWYHPVAKHKGVETVYRYVLQIAYIIDGRDLIRTIKRNCQRCRYLAKKAINVEMGPVSQHSLNIAPPFYSTQVDLCGPFSAYSSFNKRKSIKIWLVVFCCTTTSATKIHVMDDCSTPSFILSVIRFSTLAIPSICCQMKAVN
eukprot:TCONS_00035946-protein